MSLNFNNQDINPGSKYFLLLNTIPYGYRHKRRIFTIARCLNKEIREVKAMILEARTLGYIIAVGHDASGETCCYVPETLDELCEHAADTWKRNSKDPDPYRSFYFDLLMETICDLYTAGNKDELSNNLFSN